MTIRLFGVILYMSKGKRPGIRGLRQSIDRQDHKKTEVRQRTDFDLNKGFPAGYRRAQQRCQKWVHFFRKHMNRVRKTQVV